MPSSRRNPSRMLTVAIVALLGIVSAANTYAASGQDARASNNADRPIFGRTLRVAARKSGKSPAMEQGFLQPPASARPWVYWFWLNSNITRQGITADLEAMQRVGVGGVLIMEVDQGAPVGPVPFMSDKWRELFRHVVAEAGRLGLEVNMNDDAGWNGSGGPWIKPEQSMQKVVWSEAEVTGPKNADVTLPQPPAVAGYYRDITVLAFPAPGSYRIEKIKQKAAYESGIVLPGGKQPAADSIIDRGRIVDLTARMDPHGRLTWDAPAGRWTIMRFGHTSTGARNGPAPASGCGLECDKLSKEGSEAAFNGLIGRLADDVGPAVGKSLVKMHVDSWEIGSQNWTARMREEFQRRRGYDIISFLPVMSGRVVGSLDTAERFLWDLRRTISELVVENYAGHLHELAGRRGLRFTIEAYGSPCDHLPYAGQCDEPMGEFWVGGGAMETCRGMASAAHLYGKTIVGAESFTAGDLERWRDHPATIKALGDQAFCEGINRFVFHRYAMQPWTQDYRPGMTMGPWGTHYERTQTWWELTPDWHRYLGRCQYMLRQGRFVADLCYLEAEDSPQGFHDHPRQGYNWDQCNPEIVLTQMSVRDGRLVLPAGMNYHMLVLSDARTMTPALLGKLKELVEAGATIVGPRPLRSPSLSGYPNCDVEVQRLAGEIWGDCNGNSVREHRLGQGRVVWGIAPEKLLADGGLPPDFAARLPLRFIHRQADGADIYFVSNPIPQEVTANFSLRVTGKTSELWWPDSGRIERAPVFKVQGSTTALTLPLGPSGSVFVVFRDAAGLGRQAVGFTRDGKPVSARNPSARLVVTKATYGVLTDPKRTRDVKAKVQGLADTGVISFQVAEMAAGDDPAFGIVKTLVLEYTIDGQSFTAEASDPQHILLATPPELRVAQLCRASDGRLAVEAREGGQYEVQLASGQTRQVNVPELPQPQQIAGPWHVSFPAGSGAPAQVTLPRLVSWSQHADAGVKYFSGTASYDTTFSVPEGFAGQGRRLYLDLGTVRAFAQVKLNGKDLGLLWKPPFRLDVTDVLRSGENRLEASVTNLWPNRLIGDEQLPEDSQRNLEGTLKAWPKWLLEGKPSPTGRHTFTTWRLWKKNDALLDSGLLGPVRIVPAARVEVAD
jgi:hypothetical protein